MSAIGQTINILTLGGLAMKKEIRQAILDGASNRGAGPRLDAFDQHRVPADVLLNGGRPLLVRPLAEAVAFALLRELDRYGRGLRSGAFRDVRDLRSRPYIFTKCSLVWDANGNISQNLQASSS